MSMCEKCWSDAGSHSGYMRLLKEREANPCTPEQQAGANAGECPTCKRMTLHQHTGEPTCGCAPTRGKKHE